MQLNGDCDRKIRQPFPQTLVGPTFPEIQS